MRFSLAGRTATLRLVTPDPRVQGAWFAPAVIPPVEAVLPPTSNKRWAIHPTLGRFLATAVTELGCQNILEFGAGSSSLVLATALGEAGGGRLTSVEQTPEYSGRAWKTVQSIAGVDAQMVVAEPRFVLDRRGAYHAFRRAAPALAARGPFDLVLVDAPPRFFGREGALHLALPHLAPGALIALDDAKRAGERWVVRRWVGVYPGLTLVHFDALTVHGIAVLRFSGDRAVRPHPGLWSASVATSATNWGRRVITIPAEQGASTGAEPAASPRSGNDQGVKLLHAVSSEVSLAVAGSEEPGAGGLLTTVRSPAPP